MEELLTLDQIRIYARYDGDDDLFLLTGRRKERERMNTDIWHRIIKLIDKFFLLKTGRTSVNLELRIRQELDLACDDGKAVGALIARADVEFNNFLLNEHKLKIFRKYDGDSYRGTVHASVRDLRKMRSSDWKLISNLLLEIREIKKGDMNEMESLKLQNRLQRVCTTQRTIARLIELASSA